jgi:hypothetical protein
MRHIPLTCASATLALVLFAQESSGQTPAPEGDPPTSEEKQAREVSLNVVDQKLALSLAVDTRGQIEMAEFALEAADSEPTRQLLRERLERLRAFATKLETLTEGKAREAIERALREIEQDKAPGEKAAKFRLLSLRNNATAMVVRIRLEILQQYAELMRSELAGKQKLEFDRHFLRGDVLNQMQMLAALQVFEGQASADFAGVIHEAWAESKDYLERAKLLLLQLETAPLAEVTAKPALVETATER